MRNPSGYLSIGDPFGDPIPPHAGGLHGRGPQMGRGRQFGGPWGNDRECDTFTCAHCCKVVFVKPMCDPADLGGLCRGCGKHICPRCANLGNCDPYEKKLQRAEARYNFLRDAGLLE